MLLFGLIFLQKDAIAQLPIKNVSSFHVGVVDGLQQSRVDYMVYDNQGFIWLKLRSGLQLWDGQEVVSITDSIIDNTILFNVYKHPEQGVVVATPGLLRQFKYEGLEKTTLYESDFPKVSMESDLPTPIFSNNGFHIAIDKDSVITFFSKNSEQNEKVIEYGELNEAYPRRLIKIGDYKYVQLLQNNKYLKAYDTPNEDLVDMINMRWLRHNYFIDKGVLAFNKSSSLVLSKDGNRQEFKYPENIKSEYYTSITQLNKNIFLVGVDNRLFEFDIEKKEWLSELRDGDNGKLLNSGFFDQMIQDKYGDIWAVTVNEGLMKIYLGNDFDYIGSEETENNFIKNVSVSDNCHLVVTSGLNSGIHVFDTLGNQLHDINKNTTNGLVNSVTGIFETGYKRYIFNQNNDENIYQLDLTSEVPDITVVGNKGAEYLYYQDAINVEENEMILLFNRIFKYNTVSGRLDSLIDHISSKSCIIADGDFIWIGANDAILKYNWKERTSVESIPKPNEGYIRTIRHYDDDQLVFGSDKGVSLFDKQDHTTERVFHECTYCLLLDPNKNIWAGTGNGIVQVPPDRAVQRYSLADGIQGLEFNTNACVKSENGRFYFGGLNGISAFRPDQLSRYNNRQRIFIKQFSQGDIDLLVNAMDIENETSYSFNHDENHLQFKIGTIGKYEAEFYNYQYAVTGLTDGWIDVENQSRFNFSLSQGEYEFYFASTLEYDPNLEMKDPIRVRINTPWWASWWAYVGFTLFFAGIVAFIISSINRQKYLKEKYQLDLKINVQEERLSMSKELHDNIGSRLTFLVSSIGNMKSDNNNETDLKVKQLADFGRDTIADLRSYMWVLRADQITIQDLQFKTLDFINIARNSYPNIDFNFSGVVSNFGTKVIPSDKSQNTFRVIQEAVHNLVKYSNTSKAEVNFSVTNDQLVIRIIDDGIGFDVDKEVTGYGMSNMKQRAQKIAADLKIESEKGVGTLIELRLEMV